MPSWFSKISAEHYCNASDYNRQTKSSGMEEMWENSSSNGSLQQEDKYVHSFSCEILAGVAISSADLFIKFRRALLYKPSYHRYGLLSLSIFQLHASPV